MQLADHVERTCNGQSAAARPPRIPSFAVVTWPRTAVSFPPATSRLCASLPHTTALPEFSTALPMTPNIYYQRQPCLTNNSQAFTQCGTNATNIGRKVAPRGVTFAHFYGNCWLLLTGAD